MTPEPLAILSNHLSTQNQEDGGWLEDIVRDHSWVRRFPFDRIESIPRILKQCATEGIGTLAIDGGDGTAGVIFSGLLNDSPFTSKPALALIPSGKTNMTARAWGLTGNRHQAVEKLLSHHRNGTLNDAVHSQAVVTLQDNDSTPPRHGAFFGGANLVEGILYCRRAIYPLGMPNVLSHSVAAAVLLWRALLSGQTGTTLSAQFDGSDIREEGRFFVVLATTMDRMLLGIQPSPLKRTGALHYIGLRSGPGPIISAIPDLLRRRVAPGRSRTVIQARSVTILSSGQYTLDGELYRVPIEQPIKLSGHEHLRFVRW
ncbi:MAG: diacylglycerol kinase family protein [Rhodospirillaceae bacterium]